MATNLGMAWITIAPETSGISGEIAKAIDNGTEKAAKAIGKNAGLGSAIGTMLGNIATKAVSTAAGAVKDVVSDAVGQMDKVIKTKNALGQMGYDLKKVNTYMEMLKNNANSTAATYGDLSDGALKLVGAWGDLDISMKGVQALSDAVLSFGGTADQINTVITQIGQMPLDGPLNAQTWLSLTNGGLTPVLGKLAEMNKMTTGEFKDALGKGKITVKQFMNQLIEMDKKGLEPLAKSNAAATFSGAWSNAKNTVITAISDELEAMFKLNKGGEKIAKLGENLTKVVKAVLAKVKEWGSYIQQNLMPALNRMGEALSPVIQHIGELVGWLGNTIFQAAVNVFAALANVIADLAPFLQALIPVVAALVTEFAATRIIQGVITTFTSFKDTLGIVKTAVEAATVSGGGLTQALTSIGTSGSGAVSGIASFAVSLGPVGIAVTGLTAAFGLLIAGVVATTSKTNEFKTAEQFANEVTDLRTEALKREKDASYELVSAANEMLQSDKRLDQAKSNLNNKIKESGKSQEDVQKLYEAYISGTVPEMTDADRELVESYANYVSATEARNQAVEKQKTAYEKLKGEVLEVSKTEELARISTDLQTKSYDKVVEKLGEYSSSLVHTSKDGLVTYTYTADEIKQKTFEIADEIGKTDGDWKRSWESIKYETRDEVIMVSDMLNKLPDKINFVSGAREKMMEGVNQFKVTPEHLQKLKNTGENVVNGLVGGMDANMWKVTNSASKAADTFNTTFRNEMIIKSPSRLMAKNGSYIIEGLIKGIDSMKVDLKESAIGVADETARAFNDTMHFDNQIVDMVGNLSGFDYDNARVVQNNNFNVASGFDIQQAAADLGYAVAMA